MNFVTTPHWRLAFCAISFAVYTSVSVQLFRFFQCEKFEDGSHVMVADASVSCDGGDYDAMRPFIGIMLLAYPAGIPVAYLLLLCKLEARIPQLQEATPAGREELVTMGGEDGKDDKGLKLGFLWESYDVSGKKAQVRRSIRLWWWEALDMVRKQAMIAFPFLVANVLWESAGGLLLTTLFCSVYAHIRPYKENSCTFLMNVSLFALSFHLVLGILVTMEKNSDSGMECNHIGFFHTFLVG
jgi:hypothetical protein